MLNPPILQRLPESWAEISYPSYLELQELEADLDLCGIEKVCEQLAVLLDTDSSDPLISDLTSDEIFAVMADLRWMTRQPIGQLLPKHRSYELKPFNELTTGEFIDIEHFAQGGWETAPIVAAILYKQTRYDGWGNTEYEPHIYDLTKRSEEFHNMSVTAILGMYNEWGKWKADFMEKYDPLFDDTSQEPADFEPEELTSQERSEAKKAEAYEAAQKQWSWENIIWGLSGGDISRFDAIFSTNIVLLFNVLAMKKMLDV